jgi:hypothetical protein
VISEEDKNRVRLHMGYLAVQSSQTFVMGIPAGVQTQFVLEGAWARVLPSAEATLVRILDSLDRQLERIDSSDENDEVLEIGSIKLDPKAFQKLLRRYRWWQGMLANLLGVPPNQYDMRFGGYGGGSGINVPVSG